MTKHYCDCCGREQAQEGISMTLDLAVHLVQEIEPTYAAVHNGKWEPFSGRRVSLALCLTCYNLVGRAAMNCLQEVRTIHNNTNLLPT